MRHLVVILGYLYDALSEFVESFLIRATGGSGFWIAVTAGVMACAMLCSPALAIWVAYEYPEIGRIVLAVYLVAVVAVLIQIFVFRYADGVADSKEMSETVKCRECGRENSVHTAICPRCSTRLQD